MRLLIVREGLPRPQTQVAVYVEYDGDHHWTDRRQMTRDIRRTDQLQRLGWIVELASASRR